MIELTSELLKSLPEDGGSDYNRLIFEKSPYLLQHAANPVDWYPWGDEAFQKAADQDKPIFLSIGYATCHWCHVMEKESFEDPEVAELINQTFIPIKVDREERPDIDQIYMAVCQAITGSGGWPLTALLTSEKKPFFVGTYFPKESRSGRAGMLDLIPQVADLWENSRDELYSSADQITNHLQNSGSGQPGKLTRSIIDRAVTGLKGRYDAVQGGFGTAPKFPSPHNLVFLLRCWYRDKDPELLEMVEKTLRQMRLGGIFDQIGYGFHRYSTDAAWRLPHFEKMLYDQAMLAIAYTEAYQATGKEEYANTIRQIIQYVLRDMTSPEGGFYSAEDADSEGEEGRFYTWTDAQFTEELGEQGGELFSTIFNFQPAGNFLDEGSRELTGRNLLYLSKPLPEIADELGLPEDDLNTLWEKARQLLFQIREARVHPLKDDKILTDWNGLMIAALAKAGTVLDESEYLRAAKEAADFILDVLRTDDGYLLKRYRSGEAALPAHLDDYAFLAWGLIEIYQADFDPRYLRSALEITELMIKLFWDEEQGGFFFTVKGQSDLIHRTRELYDGALPSGNSIAAMNLVRLARLTSNPEYEKMAHQIGDAFYSQVEQVPIGYTQYLSALLFAYGPSYEVVIAGEPDQASTRKMLDRIQKEYHPHLVLLLRPGEIDAWLLETVPVLESQLPINGQAAAYVCRDFQCSAPTTDPAEMLKLLEKE